MTTTPPTKVSTSEFIQQLVSFGCIKTGEFVLKSGIKSNVYVDLRESTMSRILFYQAIELMKNLIIEQDLIKDVENKPVALVGVPYGVVPLASALAYTLGLDYYPVRKETKEYGHKPDSTLYQNYRFILVEDVISSGSSIIETIKKMVGKNITDVIAVVDRELGGVEKFKVEYPNIRLHTIIKMSDIAPIVSAR